MIEIEGKIIDQPISILIDSWEIHNYVYPNLVEIFQLKKRKYCKSWFCSFLMEPKEESMRY